MPVGAPVRARTPATSLRARLAASLAVALIVPLLALAVGLGVWGPRHATSTAQDAAGRDARSAAVALKAKCDAVDDAATAAARQVASYAALYGSITPDAARAAAATAARRRPEAAVAVFDADWKLLASAGTPAGQAPARAGGYGASCTQGRAGTDLRYPGLAERPAVNTRADGLVGHVVLWIPLDDAALGSLRAGLGTGSDISVLGGDGRVLASSAAAAERTDEGGPAGVLNEISSAGRPSGTVDGVSYAASPAGPGRPFVVVATVPVTGSGLLRGLGLAALLLGLLALVPIRSLAGRLSQPVTDELQVTAGELQVSRVALADTFTSFGQALEYTHDLDKLLDAVARACLHGTGAVAGMALLAEEGGSAFPAFPDDLPGPVRPVLTPRGRARALGPAATVALEALPAIAEHYFHQLDDAAAPEPLFARLPEAGPVVAIPIRSGGRLVGMLALARGQGAQAFDALALPRVRALADHAGTAIGNIRLHEEVRRLSVTDPLTGVGNVRHLTTTLSREIAGATRFDRPLTVLMLDLDHFKQVNDTLGHQFGDVVLREFAHRVLTCVREMDTLARYGGEEFAVVLPDTDIEGGCRVAERVIKVVRDAPFRQGDLSQAVTVSIGVAAFPRDGRTAAEVLHSADEALYAAKHEGRDRWEVAGISPTASAVSQAG